MTLFCPLGKNRESLLIYSTVDPTNNTVSFPVVGYSFGSVVLFDDAFKIDFLIVEENSTLNNCSQQNVTTSFDVRPYLSRIG